MRTDGADGQDPGGTGGDAALEAFDTEEQAEMGEEVEGTSPSKLGWVTMGFMAMAATGSIAQLSASAEYGLGAVTLYLLPALFFLAPVALVASELGTTWDGGVFVWVREGIGERAGFQAIWLVFVESIALYPSLLSFAAASLAFAIGKPGLASNGLYTGAVILIVFWGATLIAMRGMGATAKIGRSGLIAGTIIPAASLMLLAVVWLATDHTSATPLELHNVVPPFTGISSIVLIVSNFIAFAGLEINAVHVREMAQPRRFPRSLAMAAPLIVVMYILGSIAISVVVPNQALDLNAGAAQAFTILGDGLGISWIGQLLAGLLVFGALAAAIAWVAGPSRGLFIVGRQGLLPPRLQGQNAAGAQVPIFILQGCVVTALSLAFVLLPSVASAFWVLQAMTVILYLSMYIIMFIAAVRLRKTRPTVVRGFRAPAILLLGTVGIIAALSAMAIAFVPPAQLGNHTNSATYAAMLLVGVLVMALPAQFIYTFRKRSWVQEDNVVAPIEMELNGRTET
ncbi:MAG TPA: APC family permease [Acidimicrobiales bacterium]|nr:APC family permease [Acidimicrobiales bacterium]